MTLETAAMKGLRVGSEFHYLGYRSLEKDIYFLEQEQRFNNSSKKYPWEF
ncbi:hypothetical protein ACFL6I_14350 [candidate division KSB1 bacterium]